MTVLVLDADLPGDPDDRALENSHWVAEQIAAALASPTSTIRGVELTRARVDAELGSDAHTGVVYCGHGRDGELHQCREVLLDLANLECVGQRWFHAFACNSGNRLALSAASQVSAYLGYHRPVIVEWTVEGLPDEVLIILRDIVTAATLDLESGVRSRSKIRRRVRDAYDAWIAWREDHEGDQDLPLLDRMGLSALSRLYDCMELHGTAVRD